MTLKRSFAAFDFSSPRSSSLDIPAKRLRPFSSSPSTATSSSSLATPSSSTPYTYTPPSDSPTNPFGRIRKLALTEQGLTLPPATSYSKHLPLRFQLVRSRKDGHGEGEGTYRIVQVPLNYTFRHIRKLLHFLFDDPPTTTTTTKSIEKNPLGEGHLFEIQDSIKMCRTLDNKTGYIRSGRTWAKLSCVRDPFRRVRVGDNDVSIQGEGEGEAEEDWIWEAEEDFTVGHVWPEGGDLKRGFVYVSFRVFFSVLYFISSLLLALFLLLLGRTVPKKKFYEYTRPTRPTSPTSYLSHKTKPNPPFLLLTAPLPINPNPHNHKHNTHPRSERRRQQTLRLHRFGPGMGSPCFPPPCFPRPTCFFCFFCWRFDGGGDEEALGPREDP